MATKRIKRLLPIMITVLVLLIVAVVIISILVFRGSGVELLKGDHVHSAPIPTVGKTVEAKEDYVLVAESDNYKLYYYEPQFSIRLENKKTGAILDSTLSDEKNDGKNNPSWTGYMKSGIVLTAIMNNINTYQVDMNTVKNNITTWYTDNGIYANIKFGAKYSFEIGVEVSLIGDELVVRVPE